MQPNTGIVIHNEHLRRFRQFDAHHEAILVLELRD